MIKKDKIYKDLLNIIDYDVLASIIMDRPFDVKYVQHNKKLVKKALFENGFVIKDIKNQTEDLQLIAVEEINFSIEYITNPSELVQIESVKCFDVSSENYYMKYYCKIITSSLALNLLYKKVSHNAYKELIKSHPNYKSDAKLILDKI